MGEFTCTTKNHFAHAEFVGKCAGSARLLDGNRLRKWTWSYMFFNFFSVLSGELSSPWMCIMRMTFAPSFEIIVNACECHVNAFRAIFLNNCECSQRSCAHDSWFVLNFRIVLLDLLVGCDVCQKKRFIKNNFRNPFQYEFSSIYIFWGCWKRPHEHCFLIGWIGNVCGGRV
jgi:hypothetical protein